jgi:hypothetical protein
MPIRFRGVDDGDKICDGLRVINVEGAVAGELILHCARNGGTLIVGDALINFGALQVHLFTCEILLERKRDETLIAKPFRLRSGANPFRARRPDFVPGERSVAGFAG